MAAGHRVSGTVYYNFEYALPAPPTSYVMAVRPNQDEESTTATFLWQQVITYDAGVVTNHHDLAGDRQHSGQSCTQLPGLQVVVKEGKVKMIEPLS